MKSDPTVARPGPFRAIAGLFPAALSAGRTVQRNDQPGETACLALSHEERVENAFENLPLDAREARALGALLDSPGATATELSRACGWMATGWRTQMLLLCQRRRRYFWPDGIASDITNGVIITALTEYDPGSLAFHPRKELAGILHRAVAAAA